MHIAAVKKKFLSCGYPHKLWGPWMTLSTTLPQAQWKMSPTAFPSLFRLQTMYRIFKGMLRKLLFVCTAFLCSSLQPTLTPNSVGGRGGLHHLVQWQKVHSIENFCKYLTSLQLYSGPKKWAKSPFPLQWVRGLKTPSCENRHDKASDFTRHPHRESS